jgi:hypothetical protein
MTTLHIFSILIPITLGSAFGAYLGLTYWIADRKKMFANSEED